MNNPIHVFGSPDAPPAINRALRRALLSAAAKAQAAQLEQMREQRKAKAVTGTRKARASAFYSLP